MKVHFSAPFQDLDKRLDVYEVIANTIKVDGHTLVKEWLKDYEDRTIKPKQFSDQEWKDIISGTLAAVEEADAVVIEASFSSFSMGYISAVTLAHKKPLLMLFNMRPQPYILDPNNSLRRAEIYNSEEELRQIISDFLHEVDVDSSKLRFNMAVDREIYNFLNWEAVNTGKTKAQIVREILKERIKR